MSDSNQRKSGVILSYVSIIINTLIQLLYTPLLIRQLGQSEYGLYSLVNSIIGYLTILDLGFGNSIIVYTARYKEKNQIEEEKKLHGMFNLVFKIIGIFAATLSMILFFNVDTVFGKTMTNMELCKTRIMIIILSFNLFITFSFTIFQSIISAYEKFTFQKIIAITQSLLKPIIMIPLLFFGYKSITLCIVITIINVFTVFANYIFCRRKLRIRANYCGFDGKQFKTILGYSIWIFIGQIVDKANWSIDQFVLGAVSGTVAVSIYSVASILNNMFISLSTAISSVLLPKMSKLIAKNEKNLLNQEFIKVGRIQYYIIFFICSGLILFGKEFIKWWAGNDFEESYYVALVLIIPLCFPLIQNLGISIMQAMNKYKFKAISTFIMAIFNVIISVFLAKKYGAIGSAIGTAFSLIICNIIITNIYYFKIIKLDIIKFWKTIVRLSIPNAIPILIIVLIMEITNLNGIISVILYGMIYSLLYFLIEYKFNFNEYEKNILKNLFKKIKLVKEND